MQRSGTAPRGWRHATTPPATVITKAPTAHVTAGWARRYQTAPCRRHIKKNGTEGGRARVHPGQPEPDMTHGWPRATCLFVQLGGTAGG